MVHCALKIRNEWEALTSLLLLVEYPVEPDSTTHEVTDNESSMSGVSFLILILTRREGKVDRMLNFPLNLVRLCRKCLWRDTSFGNRAQRIGSIRIQESV